MNPPQFIVAFAPLTLLSPAVAVKVWLAINVAAAGGAAVIIWRELELPRSYTAIMLGIVATGLCTSIQFGFEEGQPIGVFALLCMAAWRAQRRREWRLAGFLLGVLVSLKPFLACFLLLPFVRREWTTLLWSVATTVLSVAVGIGAAGIHSFSRWIEIGRQVVWFEHPMNASLAGLLARAGNGWQVWLALALLLVLATVAAIRQVDDVDAGWLACGVLSLLVNPLGWMYYLPLLAGFSNRGGASSAERACPLAGVRLAGASVDGSSGVHAVDLGHYLLFAFVGADRGVVRADALHRAGKSQGIDTR